MLKKRRRFTGPESGDRYREIRNVGVLFVLLLTITLIAMTSVLAETWRQWLIGLVMYVLPSPVFFAAWLSRIRSALLDLERELAQTKEMLEQCPGATSESR